MPSEIFDACTVGKSVRAREANNRAIPKKSHPKGGDKEKGVIFGPEGLGAKRTCAPYGCTPPEGGVHEPRSEAESAVRKEKFTHMHPQGAGARIRTRARCGERAHAG